MDEFVVDQELQGQAHWVVKLTNGEVVVQDDGRPGVQPSSAWLRLRVRLEQEGVRVEQLWLRWRDKELKNLLPVHADGYFFSKACLGVFGAPESTSFYLIGALKGDKLFIRKYEVPTLEFVAEEVRDPASAKDALIRQPNP